MTPGQALSKVLTLSMGELYAVISHLLLKLEEAYGEEKASAILIEAVNMAQKEGRTR